MKGLTHDIIARQRRQAIAAGALCGFLACVDYTIQIGRIRVREGPHKDGLFQVKTCDKHVMED